jgi:hypothetical protein
MNIRQRLWCTPVFGPKTDMPPKTFSQKYDWIWRKSDLHFLIRPIRSNSLKDPGYARGVWHRYNPRNQIDTVAIK